MSSEDETKKLLEQLLSEIHAKQASTPAARGASYLQGGDDVFLGNIDANRFDPNSISNKYGPYGSRYSQTSVFNQFSPYASPYGVYSLKNPNTFTPPKLFLGGRFVGNVSSNPRVVNYIPADDFLVALDRNIASVMDGSFLKSGASGRAARGESYLEAADGTYLGSLNPNNFDKDSVFNQFGPFGSEFSPTSIFNQFGTYGSQFSQLSPFNQFSKKGPTIYLKGRAIGRLTKNSFVRPRVDPDDLKDWAVKNVSTKF